MLKIHFSDFSYILSRPSNLEINSPTFGSFEIWPFDFEQKVTLMCNQLVSSTDDKFKKDKSIGYNGAIQPQIMDSLILVFIVLLTFESLLDL